MFKGNGETHNSPRKAVFFLASVTSTEAGFPKGDLGRRSSV